MTLSEVKRLTLADIEDAKHDPDFYPDPDEQARILLARMWRLTEDAMSPESRAFINDMKNRRWVTESAWHQAYIEARLEWATDHAISRDPRWLR